MRILADDIHAIRETLLEQLQKDNEIVAYNEELVYATKRDLVFFADKESFDQYAKLHNNDHALFFDWHTKHVLNCVEAVVRHKINFDKSESFSYSDGIYTFHDPSNMANAASLKGQLEELGFEERICRAIGPALELYRGLGSGSFHLLQRDRSESEKHMYYMHFVQEPNELSYHLAGYEATLRIAPDIPDVTINGISAKELDRAMQTIDWSIDHHRDSLVEEYIKTADGNDFLDRLDMITRDVNRLYKSNGEGRDAAERLMYKHWHGEPWEPTEISLEHVCKIFEWKKEVDLIATPGTGVVEIYKDLKQNALRCADALPVTKEELQACIGDNLGEIKPGEELMTLARHFDKINLKCLERDLLTNGWEEPLFNFEWYVETKSECFDIPVNKAIEQEKMQCLLQFENAGNGWYLFKQYDATLYHQVVIAHAHINGINTNYLEEAMKKADWFYEYSESTGVWEKGFAEVRKINEAINTLCKDENGRLIATQLWNNHVPLFTIAKPAVIRKCEEELNLYQRRQFSAGTPVGDAHKELKNVVLKNELHQHQHSLVKEQTPGAQTQKDNEKPRHSHRPKIN